MRIFISADMEGATGVVNPDQVRHGSSEYDFGRKMQAWDVMAVVRACLDNGVEEVIVNDAHGRMINLDINAMPSSVHLVSGFPKVLEMVEGMEECDGVFFVAYHAMAGTEKAVLDHTFSASCVHDLTLNGWRIGETGLNAFLCGALGKPVAMVTGDVAVCMEALSLLGENVVTCAVKEGRGRSSAELLHPSVTEGLLRSATEEALHALEREVAPVFRLSPPYDVKITFNYTVQCDAASIVPGSERFSGRGLRANWNDPMDVYRWIMAVIEVASTARW